MSAKKGLGRGLDSLIPTDVLDESFDPTAEQDERVSDLRHIPLSKVVADPDQPRRTFDEESLRQLSESIREHGVLQPVVVRPHGEGYMIVAGERRMRAAQLAGLASVPALVRTLSNQHKLELSLIENLQREDLNVIETATAYLKLRDQFNLTLDEIGKRVGGKSVAAISNTLRLLRLPTEVRKALADGKVHEGQVRPLINLDEVVILGVLPRIIKEEWSARAVEQYVTRIKRGEDNNKASASVRPVKNEKEYTKKAEVLGKHLHAKVRVKVNERGRGQIVIPFTNDADFTRIAKLLGD